MKKLFIEASGLKKKEQLWKQMVIKMVMTYLVKCFQHSMKIINSPSKKVEEEFYNYLPGSLYPPTILFAIFAIPFKSIDSNTVKSVTAPLETATIPDAAA